MRRAKIMPAAAMLMVAVLIAGGCAKKDKDGAAAPPGAPGAGQKAGGSGGRGGANGAMNVETAEATVRQLSLEKQYVGEIEPFFSIELRSTGSGRLTGIRVNAGDSVRAGQVLCTIENDDIQAQAEQSKAGISVAESSVMRAEAELERTSGEARRAETLNAKGYLSDRDLEQAQSAEKQARAALATAKGQLSQAKAALKNINVKLRDTTVKAPFSGIVAERYVDPGAYVSPSTPILKMVDDSKVMAVINVVEEDFPRLNPGDTAKIISDAYPGVEFSGNVKRVAPALDQSAKTARVEILIPNGDSRLRGGMTARVKIVVAENPSALVIPGNSLRRDVEAGIDFVFIVKDGKAQRREVKTGIITPDSVEIVEGLSAGDMVITGGVRVSEGMSVEQAAARKGGPR